MSVDIRVGDALSVLRDMSDESVHCVVTSPPYWGLRAYGGDPGMIGLEPTFDEHLENLVEVFREVRRVLRPDGTLWLNYGDAYASTPPGNKAKGLEKWKTSGLHGANISEKYAETLDNSQGQRRDTIRGSGLKPKDLMMMPARVALALQADGWWLRSEIVWHKPNPMPESCRDRPTAAHEKLFLLTKSARYFYDFEAVKEPVNGTAHARAAKHNTAAARKERANPDAAHTPSAERRGMRPGVSPKSALAGSGIKANESFHEATHQLVATRNLRNVWTVPTAPYKGAHFATFPPALVEPCIKAGTSEYGACSNCGAPWVRVVEKGRLVADDGKKQLNAVMTERSEGADGRNAGSNRAGDGHVPNAHYERTTTGWRPICNCRQAAFGAPYPTRPATVLDPFAGAGTVGLVADRLGRDSILIEISHDYAEMARKRIEDDAGLFR